MEEMDGEENDGVENDGEEIEVEVTDFCFFSEPNSISCEERLDGSCDL